MSLDLWSIVENTFDIANNLHYEALLAIGSGTLQQRASFEEGLHDDPQDVDYLRILGRACAAAAPRFKRRVGTYLPGVTGPHSTCGEQIINLPAIHGLKIYTGGQRLEMETCRIREYRRWLNLRNGHLCRTFVWDTPAGASLRVHFERFISARRRHVMALRCRIEHLSGPPAELRFLGPLSAEVRTNGFDHFQAVDITGEHEPITLALTTNSGIDVACAALLASDRSIPWTVELQSRWVALCGGMTLDAGQTMRVDKFAALTSSRHVNNAPLDVARRLVWDAAAIGFDRLAAESDAVWETRWQQTDVEIDGDPESQRALRVSLYHLLRAAVEDDPRCTIDPTAGTSDACCGRYSWHTELFMLPVFLYTRPEVGQTLACFRSAALHGARRNAQRSGYAGARYAWESAPDGAEQSPHWQYADHGLHVTADVAYGLFHAHLCRPHDLRLLRDVTEVLTETARFWSQRVTYTPDRGFELLMVIGPDEYTPFVHNNAFTNRMVALALTLAGFAWQKLERADAEAAVELRHRIGLCDKELEHFTQIAVGLRLPYDESRRLVLQSDDFFTREPFDFDRYWPDRSQPLSACVSQERIARSRVLKQADVIQLMALFPHEFDEEQMRVAYATYAPLTSHDDPLSRPVHAVVAARIGLSDEAYEWWRQSVGLDVTPPNASAGIHAACAGANWQTAVFGFGGVSTRMQTEVLHIAPRLPKTWSALRFPLVWEGQPLRITIEPARVVVAHRGHEPLTACIRGEFVRLEPGQTHTVE